MNNFKRAITILIITLPSLMVNACNSSSGSTQPPEPVYSPYNPHTLEYKEGVEGIGLVAPYKIYDSEGGAPNLTVMPDGSRPAEIPDTYDDLYRAIRVAGANSTSRYQLQVLDANYVQLFKRAKASDNYLFQEKVFYGLSGQKSAKSFCLSKEHSYAINGIGADYYYLSRTDMVENQIVNEEALETFAGAYNYMFSTNGPTTGLVYASANVRLSEVTYKAPTDGDGWNAYIFINIAEGINADLGLIGIFNNYTKVCDWKLVRNCSSKYHATGTSSVEKDARFYVYQDKVATSSKHYNAETGECTGFDDLNFEVLGQSWGWTLNVTNLRTGQVLHAEDHHRHEDGSDYTEDVSPSFGRVLIAASYCPVTLGVWNWDSGAKCINVTWDHIYTASALSGLNRDNIEAYRDESTPKYELYPGSDIFKEGYAQGDYRSYHSFGVREANGTYASGATYEAGDRYLIYGVNYSD